MTYRMAILALGVSANRNPITIQGRQPSRPELLASPRHRSSEVLFVVEDEAFRQE